MVRDVEGTKRKILEAATAEFVAHGPDGTTMEKIARRAGVNKERVYKYYGDKTRLFSTVLREHVASALDAVPLEATGPEGVGEFAGRLYDYNCEHPVTLRLVLWEALTYAEEVPAENSRREIYHVRTAGFQNGQELGLLTASPAADHFHFLILALAGYWMALPQVARMVTGAMDEAGEVARRRASVVEAARRLAEPS